MFPRVRIQNTIFCFFSAAAFSVVSRVLWCSDDIAKNWTPPGPGVVRDNVGRVGDEWSVVCVELTRLVRRTVVVRVTDR